MALVGERTVLEQRQRCLTWLVGVDANDNPRNKDEQRWFEAMLRRREDYQAGHGLT